MPTLFTRYDLAAQGVQEAVFGESFTFTPMKRAGNVNGPAVADGARAVATVTGIYSERDADPNIPDQPDRMADRKPGISAHTHAIEIDMRRWPVDPLPGDILTRLADGVRWRIVSVDPDTDGRSRCNVSRA